MISIRQHNIAKAAFDCVSAQEERSKGQTEFDKKKYGALAHKLPMLILQNGLAQATGFLIAKNSEKTNEHLLLLDDLAQVILASPYALETAEDGIGDKGKALHETVINSDINKLTRLTRLSLEASGALRRYVQGVMHVDSTGSQKEESSPEKTEVPL